MPELPEVENVRLGLKALLPGERVAAVEVLRGDSVGYPDVSGFARGLVGRCFTEPVERRGKYLILHLDGKALLVVHLRMSGRLIVVDSGQPDDKHLRVRIRLCSGRELRFEDMRVFGRLWYLTCADALSKVIPGLAALGVEPSDALDGAYLSRRFARRSVAVKSALLDQHTVAGLGNIYADESLFCAGINPLKSVAELKRKELDRLAEAIKSVLERAIDAGGATIRDYANSEGVNGNYQNEAWVYGRVGEPCRQCGTQIERVRLGGRSTHYCPHCQRLSKAQRRRLLAVKS